MSCNNDKRQEATQEGESKGFPAAADEINLFFILLLIFVMTVRTWCER